MPAAEPVPLEVSNAVRCHDAVLLVRAPDGTHYELPVLWAEDGDVVPCWDDEAAETVARILDEQSGALGEDPVIGLAVRLVQDASVGGPVELADTDAGFYADPSAVHAWMRQRLN